MGLLPLYKEMPGVCPLLYCEAWEDFKGTGMLDLVAHASSPSYLGSFSSPRVPDSGETLKE